MKISHEVPLYLLEGSRNFNDYHYCLPHFVSNSIYKEFYVAASNNEEFTILDNGLFEGTVVNDAELIKLISDIKPDIFIIPDEWNEHLISSANAKRWVNNHKNRIPDKTKLMGVLQGKTYAELLLCYDLYVMLGITHIAINHSSEGFLDLSNKTPNIAYNKMVGRNRFMTLLEQDDNFNPDFYYHLLGINLSQEGQLLSKYKWVNSIDTSNPIIYAITKGKYPHHLGGVIAKPSTKLEAFFYDHRHDIIHDNIIYNVNQFKKSING